jgi:outer membrane protein assembly factor BamB/glycosyltransferase involved in cell wall biosynthesis
MRILQIIPGSGGTFYCQNCQRDLDLVRALRGAGHDVLVMPLYLPLSAGHADERERTPVFYGAVSLFLRHRFGALRHLPAWLWRALDAPPVLRLAAHQASRTRANGLSDLTVSMLRGEDGRQAAELRRLIDWLRADPRSRPDVVCLSNALLLGLAGPLGRELGLPVVCWLQDENVWPDAMQPSDSSAIWSAMRDRLGDVDAFFSVSDTFTALMSGRLGAPLGRVQTIYPGVDPAAFRPAVPQRGPPTIGFMSRLAEGEGFGLFVDAFLRLRRHHAHFAQARLRATGGFMGDRRLLAQVRSRLAQEGAGHDAVIEPHAFATDRAGFLSELSVLSVPALRGEAFGTYLIEAMAAGVPVVQPRLGAFPEVLTRAGCGVLYAPNTPEALADAWSSLLSDPARCAEEASRGRAAVDRLFTLDRMAGEVAGALADVVARHRPKAAAVRTAVGVAMMFLCALAGTSAAIAAPAATTPVVAAAPAAPAGAFRRLWTWQGDKPVAGEPVWDGTGWMALTTGGRLTALDADGRTRWSISSTNAPFRTRPSVVAGRVVAVSAAGVVCAWRVSDGAALWQVLLPGTFAHGPVASTAGVSATLALVAPADGQIFCLDAATGRRVWTSEPTQRTDGPLAAGAGLLAFGNCDAAVHVVAASNGVAVASVPVGRESQMAGGVVIAGGRVFGGTRDGCLVCVDVAGARVVWSVKLADSELFTTPAVDAACVYVATDGGDIAALRRESGATVWRRSVGAGAGSPALGAKALWLVSDGRVLAVSPADGREVFAFAAGDRVGDPVAAGGQVAVVDDNGGLIVFGE